MDESFAILRLVTLAPKRHIAMMEPDYILLKTGIETMVGDSADSAVKKAISMMFHSQKRVKVTFEQYLRMVGMVFEAGEDDDKIETSAGEILAQGISAVGQMTRAVRRTGIRMLAGAVNGPRRAINRLRSTVFVNGQNMVIAIMILFMIRFGIYTFFHGNTVRGVNVGQSFPTSLWDAFENVFFSDIGVVGAARRIWNGANLIQRYQSFIDALVNQTYQSGFLNDNPVFDPLREWVRGMTTEEVTGNITRAIAHMNRLGPGARTDDEWLNNYGGIDVRDGLTYLGLSVVNGQENPYYELFDTLRTSRDSGLLEAVLEQDADFSSSVFYQRSLWAMSRLYGRVQGWDMLAVQTIQDNATALITRWLGSSTPLLAGVVGQYFNNQLEIAADVTAQYDSMLALSSIAAVYGVGQFCMNTYRTFTNQRGVFDRSNVVNWYQTIVNSSLALSQVLNLGVLLSLAPRSANNVMNPAMIQGQIQAQAVSFVLEEIVMYWGGYRDLQNTTGVILTITVAQLYGAGNFVGGTTTLAAGGGAIVRSIASNAYRTLQEAAGQPLDELEDDTSENPITGMIENERQQIEPAPESMRTTNERQQIEPAPESMRTTKKKGRTRSRSSSAEGRTTRRTPRRKRGYIPTGSEILLRQTLTGKVSSSSKVKANEIVVISAKANAIVQTHIDSLEEFDMKEEARLLREAKKKGPQAVWDYYAQRAKVIYKEAEATDEKVDQFIKFTNRLNEEELLLRLKELQETEPRFFESADWTKIDPDEFEEQLDREYARAIEDLKERNGGQLDKKELEELNEIFSNERDMLIDEYLEANEDEEWDADYPLLEEWAEMVRYKSPYSDYLRNKARKKRVAKAQERENEFKNFDDMMKQWDRAHTVVERKNREAREKDFRMMQPEKPLSNPQEGENEFKNFDDMMKQWDRAHTVVERKNREAREKDFRMMQPEKPLDMLEVETPLAAVEGPRKPNKAIPVSPFEPMKRKPPIVQYELIMNNKWFIEHIESFDKLLVDRLVTEGKLRVEKGRKRPSQKDLERISTLILEGIKPLNKERLKLAKKSKKIDWKSNEKFLGKMKDLVAKLDQSLKAIEKKIENL